MSAQPARHPEGPRTFAAAIRDNYPLTPDVVERLERLDDGRHPSLTDMRLALGLDLDVESPWAPVREAAKQIDSLTTDAELAALLDGMYRSLASTRMIRTEINEDGVHAVRPHAPVRIREHEDLMLLVMADNRTEAGVEFSAELHGEGFGGWVEAGRTGSSLIDAGPVPQGSYLMPVLLVAGGKPHTIDLPIECSPSARVRVRIVDDETGEPAAARVHAGDDIGPVWPAGGAVRRDEHGSAWFHAAGEFALHASGTLRLRVNRGMEYEPCELELPLTPDSDVEQTVRLRRWSHMAEDGWYGGDVHVHLHYGGEYLLAPEDAALAQRAEDVHVLNMMVANQGSALVHDREHFSGAAHTLSSARHVLQWGEEYRNNFYGHMCMYGLRALVPPIYSGFRPSEHPHDVPANAVAARAAREAGGALSYAHPLFAGGKLDRVFAAVHTVEAKELPVDAALGLVDAVDLMSYPSVDLEVARLWYRLLNCGLRLAATAGTDTFMNTCDTGEFSNPPAGNRAFVRVDGELSMNAWCEGVRRGRTFVTNGAMLALEAGGRGIGDEIAARAGDVLTIEAEAGSHAPMDRLELIVNGEAVASAEAADGRSASLRHELTVMESCWIGASATGPEHPTVYGGPLFAHTSPIYVSVADAPLRRPVDAAYFIDWIERLIAMAREHGSYASDAERDDVIALFRQGQDFYRALLG